MRIAAAPSLLATVAVLLAACGEGPTPRAEEAPQALVDAEWAEIPDGAAFGGVEGVAVDGHGHIFVLHRAGSAAGGDSGGGEGAGDRESRPQSGSGGTIPEPAVFMFARNGRLLGKWGANTLVAPRVSSADGSFCR